MPLESFEEEGLERIPDLRLSQWLFQAGLDRTPAAKKAALITEIMCVVREENMTPYYKHVCKQLHLNIDQALVDQMQAANVEKLKELDEKIKNAEKNEGETEIRESMLAKAHYLSKIGNKAEALAQFRLLLDKTVLPGCRLDMIFHLIRIGFFFNDGELVTKNIDKANSLIEEGGDWDRRNRLKVYRGLHSLSVRDFDSAAKHFLDAVATFTSYDYDCAQATGSPLQAAVEQYMHSDRYFAPHARYYVREMRIRAYSQHLDSYSSLSLESMAATFGVTMPFLDAELSHFIANGRLACKIDKVAGIVETTRPDNVNSQYQAMIKHGDILLNRIQKLSQVINI
nr:unnamed protein product [Spirometra erinaceieuropaei]